MAAGPRAGVLGSKQEHIFTLAKYKQSSAELLDNLRIQYEFLIASIASWKSGFEGEALRLSATLRVLLQDSKKSKSLLAQLGKTGEYFLDTNPPIKPNNLASHQGLVVMKVTGSGTGGAVTMSLSGKKAQGEPSGSDTGAPDVTWVPRHEMENPEFQPAWVSLDNWWFGIVIQEPGVPTRRKLSLTRKQLVLSVANKDGGTHVDPQLSGAYAEITRRNSLGIMASGYGGSVPVKAPHLASVVQIAHEMVKTIERWDMLE